MGRIRNFLRRAGLIRSRFQGELSPDQPFVAIGDIHGCADLLGALLGELEKQVPDLLLVFVGDYVDRGPDSAGVLAQMITLSEDRPESITCLMGNHETMMLDFLDHPEISGGQWLRNGGAATLESFGVSVSPDNSSPEEYLLLRDQLLKAMGQEMVSWLSSRPLFWQSGNVVVTHAGADPKTPINPRRTHGLLWGHPDLFKIPRSDGVWIVHGHFIVEEPSINQGRISIDTGAYSTNRLTAAIIERENVRFLSTA